jgi:putative phosphoesterase
MLRVVSQNKDKTDLVIHLGDHVCDADVIRKAFPELAVLAVSGNNDPQPVPMWDDNRPLPGLHEIIEINGYRLLLTHGHKEGVRFGKGELIRLAQENDLDGVLFGHTHIAVCDREGGVLFLNPGSLTFPADRHRTYAKLQITKEGMKAHIVRFGV